MKPERRNYQIYNTYQRNQVPYKFYKKTRSLDGYLDGYIKNTMAFYLHFLKEYRTTPFCLFKEKEYY